MELNKVLALRGPNIWANFPMLEVWVDIGQLEQTSSDEIPGFNDRLTAWLPSMIEHRCSVGQRGGFFERLRRGTYMAHILEHVTIELQTLAGTEVGYGRTRETSTSGVYKVAIEYENEDLARACLDVARELCMAAVHDKSFDVAGEVRRLRDLAQDVCLGPSTGAIVRSAHKRGIPFRRLNSGSMVQFGHGHKQRRIVAGETSNTSAIAESIAQDKELTRKLLAAGGIPVPVGRPVKDADDAWEAAEEIGLPVVVKPQCGNHGRGVSTNLSSREQVLAAYAAARTEEEDIVVERFAPGFDHRLLVVGDRLVAAARRDPAQVVGDGVHTISQLIEAVNQDPRRGDGHGAVLTRIALDDIALQVLADQGMTADSTPPACARVLIRRNANLSTGGTATDVTDLVHPDVAARVVEAARIIGLDVTGVDVIATDIARPLEEQGGVIVELNASPGLRMHLAPSDGKPRPVGEAIVDTLFPAGENGRIPIVAVTGVNGKTTTTRLIAHIVAATGKRVGMTCTDGVYVGERRIDAGDCSGPVSAQNVLLNPLVEAAVFETARGGILRAGLGFDRCDVSVVTNIGEGDHLGLSDIDAPDALARVKRVIVEATAKHGTAVLNAQDPLVAEMAARTPCTVMFFSRDPDHAVIALHRNMGGRAVIVRDGSIVLVEGEREAPLAPLTQVPLTHDGRVPFQVENALAAAGAAWSLGIAPDVIRAALQTFQPDMKHSPGRFNLFDIAGATVIVDYGHNVSSLAALLETVQQFPHERRTVVYSAAGDRRDCDMVRQGELLGDSFDRVVLYEDHYTRGRAEGEIMGLFRQGLVGRTRVREIHEVRGAVKSMETALSMVQPGELLVIQADAIDESVAFIRNYLASRATGVEITLDDALGAAAPDVPPLPPAITGTTLPRPHSAIVDDAESMALVCAGR